MRASRLVPVCSHCGLRHSLFQTKCLHSSSRSSQSYEGARATVTDRATPTAGLGSESCSQFPGIGIRFYQWGRIRSERKYCQSSAHIRLGEESRLLKRSAAVFTYPSLTRGRLHYACGRSCACTSQENVTLASKASGTRKDARPGFVGQDNLQHGSDPGRKELPIALNRVRAVVNIRRGDSCDSHENLE